MADGTSYNEAAKLGQKLAEENSAAPVPEPTEVPHAQEPGERKPKNKK